jgi:hypothetical protein
MNRRPRAPHRAGSLFKTLALVLYRAKLAAFSRLSNFAKQVRLTRELGSRMMNNLYKQICYSRREALRYWRRHVRRAKAAALLQKALTPLAGSTQPAQPAQAQLLAVFKLIQSYSFKASVRVQAGASKRFTYNQKNTAKTIHLKGQNLARQVSFLFSIRVNEGLKLIKKHRRVAVI